MQPFMHWLDVARLSTSGGSHLSSRCPSFLHLPSLHRPRWPGSVAGAGLGRREHAGAGERGLLWTTARGSSTAWGAAELCGTEWALGGGGRATAAVGGGRSAPMPGPWPRSPCRRGLPVDPLGRRRGTGRWGRRRRISAPPRAKSASSGA
jgi:hypothetical protein